MQCVRSNINSTSSLSVFIVFVFDISFNSCSAVEFLQMCVRKFKQQPPTLAMIYTVCFHGPCVITSNLIIFYFCLNNLSVFIEPNRI